MTITVDGEAIPEQLIRLEAERLASHPDFQRIASAPEREMKLRQAAEESAINRMLMAQAAATELAALLSGVATDGATSLSSLASQALNAVNTTGPTGYYDYLNQIYGGTKCGS